MHSPKVVILNCFLVSKKGFAVSSNLCINIRNTNCHDPDMSRFKMFLMCISMYFLRQWQKVGRSDDAAVTG